MTAPTPEPSCGAAIVRALERNGVTTVFGIPGTHNLEIYRHLAGSPIEHVAPRHEQGGGYAADGFARVSGRPGVCLTTSGPGLTNACTAAATAYADSVPMLLLSPGVPRGMERADIGWLHEMKDQHAHLDSLVARSERVESAAEAVRAIDEAFARWKVERPRPVHVEIPLDVLEGAADPDADHAAGAAPVLPTPELGTVERAAALLAEAVRPAILVGGGARPAAGEVAQLAARLQALVVTTVNGKGVLPESHPLSLGASIRLRRAQELLDRSDVLLIVGSEVGDADLWGGTLRPQGQVIRVDIDAAQLHKNVAATVAIHGESRTVLQSLLERCPAGQPADPDWSGAAPALRAGLADEAMAEGSLYREIQDAMRSGLPDDVVVAGDSAQVSYYGTVHFWPMDTSARFIYPAGFATLGYGLPAAIGAKVADPSRTVVGLVGDGGFLFSVQELATAAELGICLPIVVVDNGGFEEIRAEMISRGIPPLGVDRRSPDFSALSQALGGRGLVADSPSSLTHALKESLQVDLPTVITLKV